MASIDSADASSSTNASYEDKMNHEHDVTESTNHNLPARTLAEDERPEQTKEDPNTVATREELKHTTISDKRATVSRVQPVDVQSDSNGQDKDMGESARERTPETDPSDAQDEEMKERLASPKKKRGRDQEEEESKDVEDDEEPGSSADGSVVNGSRTTRLEPEKKRPRDTSEDTPKTETLKAKVSLAVIRPQSLAVANHLTGTHLSSKFCKERDETRRQGIRFFAKETKSWRNYETTNICFCFREL